VLDRDKRGVWVYYAVRPGGLTSVATLFDTAALTPRDADRPAGARRVPRLGRPGHGRHRLGHRAQRLSPDDVGLQLLENASATGAGLVALILAFGPVSGGHFNPVVTLADRLLRRRRNRQVAVYLPAQLAGGVVGAVVANLMFELPAVSVSHHRPLRRRPVAVGGRRDVRAGGAGLRAGPRRPHALAPFAVGAYIAAAYWWSSSTSFANPMIDVARTLSTRSPASPPHRSRCSC
jgi:arsenate reductase